MLRTLSVQNIAIAENLTVDFDKGFNVITGETGAGKSILVDALGLLRSTKVDLSLISLGSESAQVTAVFSLKRNSQLFNFLEELGITDFDHSGEVVLRRLIHRQSKHRAFINDIPVSSKTLQAVAAELIDISSQFENQHLLVTLHHTRYLDQFSEATGIADLVAKNFLTIQTLLNELSELEEQMRKHERERQLLQFELNQIEEANISEDEWENIQRILAIGNKASQANQICSEILNNLTDADSCCSQQLKHSMKLAEKLDKIANNTKIPLRIDEFKSALALVEELSFQAQKTLQIFSVDEHDLQNALDRSDIYNKLLSKYGADLNDVLLHKKKCEDFLEKANDMSERRQQRLEVLATLIGQTIRVAQKLSKARKSKVALLCSKVEIELAELGMTKTRFVAELRQNEKNNILNLPADLLQKLSSQEVDLFESLQKNGFERAHFLMSANKGFEPQAIEKIASGGELSRVMLAIKNVLFADAPLSVFVFDEIDTGVSGHIAAKIGKKMADFCSQRQAICITHLPQVACFANSHFIAAKQLRQNKTIAMVKKADESQRISELAKMLSGEKTSDESLAQARRLVSEARHE